MTDDASDYVYASHAIPSPVSVQVGIVSGVVRSPRSTRAAVDQSVSDVRREGTKSYDGYVQWEFSFTVVSYLSWQRLVVWRHAATNCPRGTDKSGSIGRMAHNPDVRHDAIVVPEHVSLAQVRGLAEQKAQAQVLEDEMVFDLQLGPTAHPVGGETGTEIEWPFSYQVVPPGGSAAARPR
jgi:hypothetical protein